MHADVPWAALESPNWSGIFLKHFLLSVHCSKVGSLAGMHAGGGQTDREACEETSLRGGQAGVIVGKLAVRQALTCMHACRQAASLVKVGNENTSFDVG